ncbi:CAP domain-containing protein [Streptomyces sp. NPDC005574]|uniref:CAP domain-containing protein n=1 Tax=Streptomyces sp. NPDC005574 TaxID=3156891 RepID=UPI0033B6FAF5
MGRHRRSDAGRAATGRATGVTQTRDAYTGSHDPLDSYSFDRTESPYVPRQRGAYTADRGTMGIAPYLNAGVPVEEPVADTEVLAEPYAVTDEVHVEASARSAAYLFATDDDFATVFPDEGFAPGGSRRGRSHRRKRRTVTPVRTGLLGVSAAVALGTVAVATGAVPGLDNYKLGGTTSSGEKVQAADSPTNSATEQGGTSGDAGGTDTGSRDDGSATSRDAQRATSPTQSASAPSASASAAAPTKKPAKKPKTTPGKKAKATPPAAATKVPKQPSAPVTVSAQSQAGAEVLALVNEERAKVGCSALSANSALSGLATDFSDAMAAEGFFDHTDPSGATPWDRAEKAGISGLGGENIARGQADAAAVMEAWMDSPGHKANILNCDFKTLGVGVHFGSGGPWWTQDFGY